MMLAQSPPLKERKSAIYAVGAIMGLAPDEIEAMTHEQFMRVVQIWMESKRHGYHHSER